MNRQPSAAELVEAVRAFLADKVLPEVHGRTAFHARVAINALAIVERELQSGPAARRAALARLEHLVADQAAAGGDEDDEQRRQRLERELCRRIRSGALPIDDPALAEHLWQSTLDALAIDQPGYSGYRAALGLAAR